MENLIKRINIIFLIAVLLVLCLTLYKYVVSSSSKIVIDGTGDAKINKIKILVDPGHGGVDPGTSGDTGAEEAPINLAISLKLMKFLEGSGFNVEMTRYDENALYTEKSTTYRAKKNEDLLNRVKVINNSQADLAVSIHLNAFPQKQYYGAHVFYQKNVVNSKIAADILQDSLKNILDKTNERVPQIKKNIKIMDDSNIPIVLIECGFLSNNEEEQKLISDDYQEKVAWAVYIGLIQYFNQLW